ncbi:MAG TPA: response regulator [Planctomycetota bacterium]|nr:response regulator [Planctomycetota bacterium]
MQVTDFVVLLVEDDPDHVLLIQRAFSKANLVNPLRIVRDGEDAISYLAGKDQYSDRVRHPLPSLILLDLKLPRKSGLEVLSWLRGEPNLKTTPVVILSSSSEAADIEKAYALGVNSYLVKPVNFGDLLEMVKSIGMYWLILNRSVADPRTRPH